MAEVRKRTIRLSGLGESLEDRIKDLRDVAAATRTEGEREEINRLAEKLDEVKEDVQAFCRAWSREFDVYE